jgi:hypothetical protein
MEVADAKHLRELEKENARLKRLLAESAIEIDAMKEVIAKSGKPRAATRRRLNAQGVESLGAAQLSACLDQSSRRPLLAAPFGQHAP